MAHKFNSVVHFTLAGVGDLPGIVIKSQLQQVPESKDLIEVLTLFYAHPVDADFSHHNANAVGDIAFSVKPKSATNRFGWFEDPALVGAHARIAFLDKKMADADRAVGDLNKQLETLKKAKPSAPQP